MIGQTIRACFEQDGVNAGDTVIFTVDASGGFPFHQWEDVVQQLTDALRACGALALRLSTFDTNVTSERLYLASEFDDLPRHPLRGGGGTMPHCVFEHYRGLGPIRLYMLTDGYFNADPPPYPDIEPRYLIWQNARPDLLKIGPFRCVTV
jgi:hypothetical protein